METDLNLLAKMIDHCLLAPGITDDAIVSGCELAERHHVSAVCVNPFAVQLAADILADTAVSVGTAVGYPYGHSKISAKVAEAEEACADGATEVEFVLNGNKVLSGDWAYTAYEIRSIHAAITSCGAVSKLSFRNDFVGDGDAIARICEICNDEGVSFIKARKQYGYVKQPSGAYAHVGANDDCLSLMRRTASPQIQIEAAGGLRTLDDLLRVKALGVTRIGATATERILVEACARGYGEDGVFRPS